MISSNITNYGIDIAEWVTFTTYSGYGAYQFRVVSFVKNGNYVPTKVSIAWW